MFKNSIKVVSLLLSMVFLFSCGKENDIIDKPDDTNKTEVVNEFEPIVEEVDVNLIENMGDYEIHYGASGEYEINGKTYNLDVELTNKDENDAYHALEMKVNDASILFSENFYNYSLPMVKIVAFNDDENIHIFTAVQSENDWLEVICYRYDGMSLYPVSIDDDGEICDALGISNTSVFVMDNITNDGFTTLIKTHSAGMWNLVRELKFDGDKLILQKSDNYEIDCKSFLEWPLTADEMIEYGYINSKEEYDYLQSGYAMCHQDYGKLKAGEYFTLLRDNNNNTITIQTMGGEQYDINVAYDAFPYETREAISKIMFYLAG